MTRKDYIAIAQVLSDLQPARRGEAADHHFQILVSMADYLATDNDRFDRSRFLEAASGEGALHYGA